MSSNVNAHNRSERIARRHGGSDNLADIGYFPHTQRPRRFGLLGLLKGETVVESRTTDGDRAVIRVPHSILAVLVTVALALIAGGFWLVSSITEIKTNLATIQANQRDLKAVNTSNLKLMIAYSTNETSRVQFMTGLLSSDRQRQLFEWDKANPRPPLPNPGEMEEENK